MLPAAWRKMWVSSAIGTGLASTSSANGLPAPTGASWSASPTSTTCVSRADGAQERDEQLEVGHRGLVDDQEVGFELVDGRALVGDPAEGGVDVEASRPLDSAIRRAARPVGATSSTEAFCSRGGRADQPDRRGLARARAAGDDREARGERSPTAADCSGAGTRSVVAGDESRGAARRDRGDARRRPFGRRRGAERSCWRPTTRSSGPTARRPRRWRPTGRDRAPARARRPARSRGAARRATAERPRGLAARGHLSGLAARGHPRGFVGRRPRGGFAARGHPRVSPPATTELVPAPEQWAAVEAAFASRLSIVTGGPGTGKTATIRLICAAAAEQQALDRARRAHRPRGAPDGGVDRPRGDHDPLRARLDPGPGPDRRRARRRPAGRRRDLDGQPRAARHAAARRRPQTHVVLVGDADQLAPVGAGKPFAELVEARPVPVAELTHIFRQAAGSMIVRGAHAVRTASRRRSPRREELTPRPVPDRARRPARRARRGRLARHRAAAGALRRRPAGRHPGLRPRLQGRARDRRASTPACARRSTRAAAGPRRPAADRRQADALRPQPARPRADERHDPAPARAPRGRRGAGRRGRRRDLRTCPRRRRRSSSSPTPARSTRARASSCRSRSSSPTPAAGAHFLRREMLYTAMTRARRATLIVGQRGRRGARGGDAGHVQALLAACGSGSRTRDPAHPLRVTSGRARAATIALMATAVAHLSVAERAARGKAARAEVPRSSHAEFGRARARRTRSSCSRHQAATRVPELVPIRYGRMLVSPFTFYRGAALLMAADLPPTPRSGLHGAAAAATRTCRTSASSPRPTAGSSSTSTTSTRRCPGRGSGTSSGSPPASRSPAATTASARGPASAIVLAAVAGLPDRDARVRGDAQPRGLVRPARRRDDDRSGSSATGRRASRAQALDKQAREGAHPRQPAGARRSSPTSSTASADHQRPAADRARSRSSPSERARGRSRPLAERCCAQYRSHAQRDRRHLLEQLPARRRGAQGRRRRQRRHPRLDPAAPRPRRHGPAVPAGQGGAALGARAASSGRASSATRASAWSPASA